MKNSIFIIMLIVFCSMMSAQDAIICGKITNPKSDNIKFYQINSQKEIAFANLDSTGYFHLVLGSICENYYYYFHGDEFQTLYLQPDDSIYLTIDTKFFDETVRYSGKGAEESNLFVRLYMIDELLKNDNVYYKELYTNTPSGLFERIEKIRDVKLSVINEYLNDTNISRRFLDYERNKAAAECLYSLQQVKGAYKRYNPGMVSQITDSVIELHITSQLFFNVGITFYYQYQTIIYNYLQVLANNEFKRDSTYYTDHSYGFYAALIKVILDHKGFEDGFRDWCIYYMADKYLSNNYSFDKVPGFYNDVRNLCFSDSLKSLLEKKISKFSAWIGCFSSEDSLMLMDKEFTNFAKEYIYGKAYASTGDPGGISYDNWVILQLDIVDKEMSSRSLSDYVYLKIIQEYLDDVITQYNGDIIKRFNKKCSNEKYKTVIKTMLDDLKSLKEGQVAPDFQAHDIDGKEYHLADFKGSFVYIDLWATWCGPCRREIPHLESLQEEFTGKNIVFISISLDNNINEWKTMVKGDKMKGVQLHADGDWKSGISEKYMVSFIPRFIFIDDKGKIISSMADRPSSGAVELIKKYVK